MTGDMMTFPDTWEEYEKDYGFTDTEQVYTNGSRLIQSFRVKQWLEHIEQKSSWIPVSRSLPSQTGEYLATVIKGAVFVDKFGYTPTTDGGWYDPEQPQQEIIDWNKHIIHGSHCPKHINARNEGRYGMTKRKAMEILTDAVQANQMTEEQDEALAIIQKAIESRPQGSWIRNDSFECDQCHYKMVVGGGAYNYCPNCGCHMQGEDK